MTGGSVLAVLSVVAVAAAPSYPVFVAAWLAAGLSMSAVLYPPAFAAVVGWFGGASRTRALTTVTLVGGLASTVFAPLTAVLAQHFSWRTTYLVLAAVLCVVTVPLHALCLRKPWSAPAGEVDEAAPSSPASVTRTRPFVMLAVSLALASFAFSAGVVTLVPLLVGRHISVEVAALALGLGGVGQVLGRLGYAAMIRRLGLRTRTMLAYGLGGIATLVLGVVPGPAALLIIISVATGALRGISTLLQATAITDRWGAASYAALSGLLSAPAIMAAALAPWVGTSLAAVMGGYPSMFVVLACLLGAAGLLAVATMPARALNAEQAVRD